MSNRFIKKYICLDGTEIVTHVANIDNVFIEYGKEGVKSLRQLILELKCREVE